MNTDILNLEPRSIWQHFSEINAIPRASKKEARIIAFMVDFGKRLNLETITDQIGNVVIKKPATKGFENRKTVVLQSHLDMVHQKNNSIDFDFETQGIEMYIDNDWVKANGTTLGADNGLGVATMMAILSSNDLEHPKLECLFTIDEETGMTGAIELDNSTLSGDILLNLDTEEDDEIGIGCAGGIDITGQKKCQFIQNKHTNSFQLEVKGLQGGHSGMDIHKKLGNANKIANEIILKAGNFIAITSIDGGGLRNAIPRESIIKFNTSTPELVEKIIHTKSDEIKTLFKEIEPQLEVQLTPIPMLEKHLAYPDQEAILFTIHEIIDGVFKMSTDIADLVETSNNLARVQLVDENCEIQCLTRSSNEGGKNELTNNITNTFDKGGFTTSLSGDYPGWQPNPNSEILKIASKTYQNIFNKKANHLACHAGLECGIIGAHYPNLDMISIGPTIKGAHSPDERVNIPSVNKFWRFITSLLKEIPKL